MCVGDEIVSIGERLLSSSSHQEICELMNNLPVTLVLEVRRPVSGESPTRLVAGSDLDVAC